VNAPLELISFIFQNIRNTIMKFAKLLGHETNNEMMEKTKNYKGLKLEQSSPAFLGTTMTK
jgi:hypothetical protein